MTRHRGWIVQRAWQERRQCTACKRTTAHRIIEEKAEDDQRVELELYCVSCGTSYRLASEMV
ncbi:MAG: hypothetical protein IT565_03275 [Rhodospirillales bacterium]|nr:hypothetical protein [Rhodospirillales bacterium]